jgi:hypothetical protein
MITTVLVLCSFIIFCIILMKVYRRYQHSFWDMQPVQHTYQWFPNQNGIIRKTLPKTNMYCDFTNIRTFDIHDHTTQDLHNKIVQLIQSQYLQNGANQFFPKTENMMPYFTGHLAPSYMSVYSKPNYAEPDRIIGSITSRPVLLMLNNEQFQAYYVDYLCVHAGYRGKSIAPKLIQTHEYFQSHANPMVNVSIFKREDELTDAVVPICSFSIHCYDMRKWNQLPDNNTLGIAMPTSEQDLRQFYDQMTSVECSFKCLTSVMNFIELVKSGNLFCCRSNYGLFVFRKSCTFVEEGCEMLVLIASICLKDDQFMKSFQYGLQFVLLNTHGFTHLGIERLGHNGRLIDGLSSKPIAVNSMAYYLYNYAYPSVLAEDVLLLL